MTETDKRAKELGDNVNVRMKKIMERLKRMELGSVDPTGGERIDRLMGEEDSATNSYEQAL